MDIKQGHLQSDTKNHATDTKEDVAELNGHPCVQSVGNGNAGDADEKQRMTKVDVIIERNDVSKKYPEGGWGWMIVFGCLLLRTIIGNFEKSIIRMYI